MLQMKRISEMYDLSVFIESGEFFGAVEEIIMTQSRVYGWKITPKKNSLLTKLIGNAKGVIVPHNLIKAVGDIIIIDNNALPSNKGEED